MVSTVSTYVGKGGVPVSRKSYGRLPETLGVPNLVEVQLGSFRWFQERGLKELLDEVSPIKDFTGNRLELSFVGYEFREPRHSEQECRQRDLTYSAPLYVMVRLLVKETGEIKVYMVNITAETEEMLRRAELVEDSMGRYVMVDILTCGYSAVQTVRERGFDLVIHAHRAGHAAFTRSKTHGINMRVIAEAVRTIGVDQLHGGTAVGKMSETSEEVKSNIQACTESMHGFKRVLPVASGGLFPGLVPRLIEIFGMDFAIQAGGGIHGHPKGTIVGSVAMRQAIDATIHGLSLKEYAKDHVELAIALETWARE